MNGARTAIPAPTAAPKRRPFTVHVKDSTIDRLPNDALGFYVKLERRADASTGILDPRYNSPDQIERFADVSRPTRTRLETVLKDAGLLRVETARRLKSVEVKRRGKHSRLEERLMPDKNVYFIGEKGMFYCQQLLQLNERLTLDSIVQLFNCRTVEQPSTSVPRGSFNSQSQRPLAHGASATPPKSEVEQRRTVTARDRRLAAEEAGRREALVGTGPRPEECGARMKPEAVRRYHDRKKRSQIA